MNWNDIPVFLAIADERSLAGAARRLKVNHSTVFRRLAALENEAGQPLFDRLPAGYRLNELGETLLDTARAARVAMDAFERQAAGADRQLLGDVRLTTAPNLAADHVPQALRLLKDRHPGIRVEVLASDLDQDLARREADLALRATTRPPETLIARKVAALQWACYANASYLAERGRPDCVDDLARHAVIGAEGTFRRVTVFRSLHDRLPADCFTATADTLTTMSALARAGVGVAALPSDQATHGLERLFLLDSEATGLWLLMHPDLRRAARVRAVAAVLFESLQTTLPAAF